MSNAFIHYCGHTNDYRCLNSQVSCNDTFYHADTITPIFTETCCCEYCWDKKHIFLPYTAGDHQNRLDMTRLIDSEYDKCVQSIEDYNDFASQHNLCPILVSEFEHMLMRVYSWITRAEQFAMNNSPRYFHDVCLAIAETTLGHINAMRLSIDLATAAMPLPETAGIVHPDDIVFPYSGIPKLRDLCPELNEYSTKLSYDARMDYGIQPLPQGYAPFEAVWRAKVKWLNSRPKNFYLEPATFGSW